MNKKILILGVLAATMLMVSTATAVPTANTMKSITEKTQKLSNDNKVGAKPNCLLFIIFMVLLFGSLYGGFPFPM